MSRARRDRVGDYDTTSVEVDVGDGTIRLRCVDGLERYVDREALLRHEMPPEPPYWAHCWSGARVLATAVSGPLGQVVEIGCGLGLAGVAAVRRGARRVVFADREATALGFVRRTLADNGLRACDLVVADFLTPPWKACWDVVLAAEILYDRAAFAALADALAAMLAPEGRVLMTDGHRIDTSAFYREAQRAGLCWSASDVTVHEDGFPLRISLVTLHLA